MAYLKQKIPHFCFKNKLVFQAFLSDEVAERSRRWQSNRKDFSLRADIGLAYDCAEALALAPLPRRELLGRGHDRLATNPVERLAHFRGLHDAADLVIQARDDSARRTG